MEDEDCTILDEVDDEGVAEVHLGVDKPEQFCVTGET